MVVFTTKPIAHKETGIPLPKRIIISILTPALIFSHCIQMRQEI